MSAETSAHALGWLLTYLLHSSALLGAAWLLARRLPRNAISAREGLWKLALLAGLATSSLQVALGLDPWLGRFRIEPAPSAPIERSAESPLDGLSLAALAGDAQQPALASAPAQLERAALSAPANALLVPEAPALFAQLASSLGWRTDARDALRPHAPALDTARAALFAGQGVLRGLLLRARQVDWIAFAARAWALAALLGLAHLLLGHLQLALALRSRRVIAQGPAQAELARLCRAAGCTRRVRLSSSPALLAPVAFGWWRCEICLPERALEALSPAQLRSMLAHELAHLLRRDPLWLLLGGALERVLFVQPLNRVARREIEDASEYQCDAWAMRNGGGGLPLASCLTEVAGWLRPGRGPQGVGLVPAMASRCSRLSERVERLLAQPDDEPRQAWLAPACTTLCCALVLGAPAVVAQRESARAELRELAESADEDDSRSGAPDVREAAAEPAGSELELALGVLDEEILGLTRELAELRSEIGNSSAERALQLELAQIERRVRDLARRRARLHALAALLAAQESDAPSDAVGVPAPTSTSSASF